MSESAHFTEILCLHCLELLRTQLSKHCWVFNSSTRYKKFNDEAAPPTIYVHVSNFRRFVPKPSFELQRSQFKMQNMTYRLPCLLFLECYFEKTVKIKKSNLFNYFVKKTVNFPSSAFNLVFPALFHWKMDLSRLISSLGFASWRNMPFKIHFPIQ